MNQNYTSEFIQKNEIRIRQVNNGYFILIGCGDLMSYAKSEKVAETFENLCLILKSEFGLKVPGSDLAK